MGKQQPADDPIDNRESIMTEAEARFRSIFLSAPVGIVLVDLETDEIIEANASYYEIVGRSKEEILSIGWRGLIHPDDLPEANAQMNLLRQRKTTGYSRTKRYIKPEGDIVWAKIEVTLIDDYGSTISPQYLVIVVDITERKMLEQ